MVKNFKKKKKMKKNRKKKDIFNPAVGDLWIFPIIVVLFLLVCLSADCSSCQV